METKNEKIKVSNKMIRKFASRYSQLDWWQISSNSKFLEYVYDGEFLSAEVLAHKILSEEV